MSTNSQTYLLGGGIGSLAAAAFMIRDGGIPGGNISILEAAPVIGGSLDGAGDPAVGYSLRGGRMLTTDNYECTWNLFKSIPSLNNEGKTVFDETVEFNEKHQANSMARLVDRRRAKVPVTSMGFSMQDAVFDGAQRNRGSLTIFSYALHYDVPAHISSWLGLRASEP